MKAKMTFIILSSLSLSSMAYAEDYYSSQTSNGYYSSQSNSDYYSSASDNRPQRHHKEERNNISISVNMPGYGTYIADKHDRRFVPEQQHHHPKGPEWLEMSYGMPLPDGAIAGGFEHHKPLYICRAPYRGGMHPGKIINGKCHISWGGNEIIASHYQVLTSYFRLNWIPVSYGDIPARAIQGGYEYGSPLYVCQAQYHGGMHPGKVIGQNCDISWGGREIPIPHYNVLAG